MKHKIYLYIVLILSAIFMINQVSWTRQLELLLGSSMQASVIILSSFMGGIVIGSNFCRFYINKAKSLSMSLIWLLSSISVVICIAPHYFKYLENFRLKLFSGVDLISILVFLFVILSSSLMVAIYPLINEIYHNIVCQKKQGFSLIYGLETMGSVLGTILTAFYLLGNFSFNFIAIGSLICIFIIIIIIFYFKVQKSTHDTQPVIQNFSAHKSTNEQICIKNLYLMAFFLGFLGLSLEIIWMRFFKIYLANSIYSFALITAISILGLSCGAFLFHLKRSTFSNVKKSIIYVWCAYTFFLVLSFFVVLNTSDIFILPLLNIIQSSAGITVKLVYIPLLISFIIIFPGSICSGMLLSSIYELLPDDSNSKYNNFAGVYFYNGLGSFLGPFLVFILIIPILGIGKSIILFILSIISLLILFIKRWLDYKKMFGMMLLLLSILYFIPQIIVLPPSFNLIDREIEFYRETKDGTIVVARNKDKKLVSYVNNAAVIGNNYGDFKVVKLLGHLPFLLGRKIDKALIVGLGMGVTASTVARYQDVKNIDCIELVSGIEDALYLYSPYNNQVYKDKRLTVINDDGRHYLKQTSKSYDLISSDPTHPILGSGDLYTKEYFELVKNKLTTDGVITHYLPLHKLTSKLFLRILKNFSSTFKNSYLWLGGMHGVLIGSEKSLKIDFNDFAQKANQIRNPLFYSDPFSLASLLVMDRDKMLALSSNLEFIHDEASDLSYYSLECFEPETYWNLLDIILKNKIDDTKINNFFKDKIPVKSLQSYYLGTELFIESTILQRKHQYSKAISKLKNAIFVNRDNKEYPFLLKYYYNYQR